MLRYVLAAQALKAFSLTPVTRRGYRRLGNLVGGRKRAQGIPAHYIARANENLAAVERIGGIADGMRLLELGTGWVHWEGLFFRLFYDVEAVLFDVWDNRQFPGFVSYARELRRRLAAEVDRPAAAIAKAEALLDELVQLDGFEAVYRRLGWTYLIEPTGALSGIPDGSIDLVISSDVLEHVPASAVDTLIADLKRVVKPGGLSAHQIVPSDHLCIYDRTVNGKNYIRYPDWQWKLFFENEVQYINRIQRPEWRERFSGGGFDIVADEIVASVDISSLKPSQRFAACDPADLAATVIRTIARKPA